MWNDLDTGFLCESGCGVYSSISGSAPNRIANLEWRAEYVDGSGDANFEIRLYEGQSRFDLIYGQIDDAGENGLIGVQRELGTHYTQYSCLSDVISQGLMLTFTSQACATATPQPPQTASATPTNTPTSTNTPISSSTTTPASTSTSALPSETVTLLPTSTALPCAIQFTDVPEGHTFFPFIGCLACLGIVSGYDDDTFRPGNNVTRGQLSKIVSTAAGFNDPQTAQLFEDVPLGSTFFDFVGRLASRGYMSGYLCGNPGEPCNPPDNRPYFRPNGPATRGQISKIVSNAANFIDPPGPQQFEDVPPGSTFYDFINRLASRTIMNGYPCGGLAEPCAPPDNLLYFRPSSDTARGQTSKIVANTFYPNCSPSQR